jgi:hypothetical protein
MSDNALSEQCSSANFLTEQSGSTDIRVHKYRGYLLPKIQPLKLDKAYFGSTTQISKNLIVDPRVTYCTSIKLFDYLDLIK